MAAMGENEEITSDVGVGQFGSSVCKIRVSGVHKVHSVRLVGCLGCQQRVLDDCLCYLEEDQAAAYRARKKVSSLDRRHETVVDNLGPREERWKRVQQTIHEIQAVREVHYEILWLREVYRLDVSHYEHLWLLEGGAQVVEVDTRVVSYEAYPRPLPSRQ